jgi:hypothetical protein
LKLEEVEGCYGDVLLLLVRGWVHLLDGTIQTITDTAQQQIQFLKGSRGNIQAERMPPTKSDLLRLAQSKTLQQKRGRDQRREGSTDSRGGRGQLTAEEGGVN